MVSYPAAVTFDLALKINNRIVQQFENIESRFIVDSITESGAEVNLVLNEKGRPSFGRIYVFVDKFDDGRSLFFEIMGNIGESETYRNLNYINIDDLMKNYGSLRPVYITGVMKRPGRPDESRIITTNTFEVRFRILDEEVESEEDYSFDFDDEKMVDLTIPYVKAMMEIDHVLRPESTLIQ